MSKKKVTVEIEKVVHGGYGLAHAADGTVYMVLEALPGEVMTLTALEERKGVTFARTGEIRKRSPERTEPFCPWFGTCGGCRFQHAEYPHQVDLKTDILSEALTRLAGIKEPRITHSIASPAQRRYRVKVTFQVKDGVVGFFKPESHDIVEIDECPITQDTINAALVPLRRLCKKEPSITEITCLYSPWKHELVLAFQTSKRLTSTRRFDQLIGTSRIKGYVLTQTDKDLSYKRTGPDSTQIKAGDRELRSNVRAFIQNNPSLYDAFLTAVEKYLTKGRRALDVYCGMGFFSLILAEHYASVTGIESDYYSYRNALFNKKSNHITNIRFVNASFEDPELEEKMQFRVAENPIDCALIDPPRAGMSKAALDRLLSFDPQRIVYVSCEPTTLARDITLMSDRYDYVETVMLDMFPQTGHIESITLLVRK